MSGQRDAVYADGGKGDRPGYQASADAVRFSRSDANDIKAEIIQKLLDVISEGHTTTRNELISQALQRLGVS
jgi:hypothetical protein